jgi:hypothetical protein
MSTPRNRPALTAALLIGLWAAAGVAAPAFAQAGAAGEANRSDTRRMQRALAEQNRSHARKLRRQQQAKTHEQQRTTQPSAENSGSSTPAEHGMRNNR